MSITINVNEAVETITATIVDGDDTITATINELPRGAAGPQGPTGATGAAGPNSVSTTTSTTITGILKGNGSTVLAATAGTDYLTPTGNGSGLTGLVSAQITDATSDLTPNTIVLRGANGEALFGDAEEFSGDGVSGFSDSGYGVLGFSEQNGGVKGVSNTGLGVFAFSLSGTALEAISVAGNHANFGEGKFIIANNGDTTLTGTIAASNLSGTNTGDQDLSGLAPKPEAKSSNFTAANGASYVSTATLTVTDPSPAEGQGFSVLVRNGTATIGGTAFATAGTVIRRVFHSGAWQNYIYLNSAQLSTLATTTPGTGVATFLATPTSANLAAAVTDKTGSNSLVFGTSPTITTPTISRASTGLVYTAQDNNGASSTFTTDANGRSFLAINGKSGAVSFGGAYMQLNGYEEAWTTLNVLSNTSGQRVMRFGTLSNRFSIQRLNDAISSITATPFSFANNAPSNAFYMSTSGGVGFGTTSDPGAGGIQTTGKIISGDVVRLKGYTFATLPAGTQGDKAFITDGAALPIFRANAAGGGSTVTEVFYNGTNWINS
jgi:hypothetical protein